MLFQGNRLCFIALAGVLAVPAARAQFAVVDVGAIGQLIAQARTLEEQLSTSRDHLAEAQAEFSSITGARGMERLLANAPRNYLPADWQALQSVLQGSYGSLSGDVLNAVNAAAVLTPEQLGALPADVRQQIDTSRRLDALLQTLTRAALSTTSNRFTSLQQLIDALPVASDQKAILELQARVGAENAMLENEQTKLQTLFQTVQAQEHANEQQMRERTIVGHGQFAARFQPHP